MRAVLDTNVLLSGLIWHRPPHTLIEQIRGGSVILISSRALIAELTEVVARPKFASILARSSTDPERMVAELRRLGEILDPPPLSAAVSRDPDDDAVLALAVAAQADCIVSGDADLLVLGAFAGIPIVGPARAVALARGG